MYEYENNISWQHMLWYSSLDWEVEYLGSGRRGQLQPHFVRILLILSRVSIHITVATSWPDSFIQSGLSLNNLVIFQSPTICQQYLDFHTADQSCDVNWAYHNIMKWIV